MRRFSIYFHALLHLSAIALHSCSRGNTTALHTTGHHDKLVFITLKAELSGSSIVISPVSIIWSAHMLKNPERVTLAEDRWTVTFLDDENKVLKSLQIDDPLKPEREVHSPEGPMERKTLALPSCMFSIRTMVSTRLEKILVSDSNKRSIAQIFTSKF